MECSFIARMGVVCLMLITGEGNGSLVVDSAPTTVIGEEDYELDRPEGVAFSPSGEYVAVANALVDKVTFYRRIGDQGSAYEKRAPFLSKGKTLNLTTHTILHSRLMVQLLPSQIERETQSPFIRGIISTVSMIIGP
jgi:hypothetical protein